MLRNWIIFILCGSKDVDLISYKSDLNKLDTEELTDTTNLKYLTYLI